MKNWLLITYFLVTWSEYKLVPHYDGHSYWEVSPDGGSQGWYELGHLEFSTVEISTFSVKLATQKDVDLFVGYEDRETPGKEYEGKMKDMKGDLQTVRFSEPSTIESRKGIISKDAFNVKIEEHK